MLIAAAAQGQAVVWGIGCRPDNAINSQKAQAQHALTDALAGCPPLTKQAKQMCQRLFAQTLTSGNGSAGHA